MPVSRSRKACFTSQRQRLNLSQRQVCIDLNLSESHYRNIESGRGNPDAKLLFRLAKYFGVPAEELFPDLAEVEVADASKHLQSLI